MHINYSNAKAASPYLHLIKDILAIDLSLDRAVVHPAHFEWEIQFKMQFKNDFIITDTNFSTALQLSCVTFC